MTNSLDLRHGDCLDVLKTIADNSIDSIVTDPPYGLEFMGKEWDAPWKSDRRQTFDGTLEDDRNSPFKRSKVRYGLGPSYNNRIENMFAFQEWVSEWAFECYRVLKPGGYLLSFGGTRTYHWIAAGIEIAGFEIRDMVNWMYSTGFPKSLNVGKAIDKLLGAERQVIAKTGQRCGVFAHSGGGKEQNIEDYEAVITAPASDEAKQWEGWGTALKPAHEPICVARKPISEKSVAENILTWGTGAMNIDESRVEGTPEITRFDPNKHYHDGYRMTSSGKEVAENNQGKGRWPANLIHDGSVEVTEEFPKNNPSGKSNGNASKGEESEMIPFRRETLIGRNDEGSASRFFKATPYDNDDDTLEGASFFYCAKASTSERDEGMTGEAKPVVTFATANGTSGKLPVFTVGRNRIEYVTNDSLSEDLLKEIQEALDGQARP